MSAPERSLIEDGGPAFPCSTLTSVRIGDVEQQTVDTKFVGMTVRDYFAASAAQGMLANEMFCGGLVQAIDAAGHRDDQRAQFHAIIARRAYIQADAMLSARKAPAGGA